MALPSPDGLRRPRTKGGSRSAFLRRGYPMILIHDSLSEDYRSPVGAVPTDAFLLLHLQIQDEPPGCQVTLRVFSPEESSYPMRRLGVRSGRVHYEVRIGVGSVPRLLWYRFEIRSDHGVVSLGAPGDGLGGNAVTGREDCFQVTVYDADYDTPHWIRESVAYQIMPDRFFRGEGTEALLSKKENLPSVHRHASWDEIPGYIDGAWGGGNCNDFFGGNLEGIRQKLPYLQSLGVTVIYLNPIFDARSNHKYDTSDYTRVDPMFGTEEDFERLCRDAREMGMRIMLDGVFSHVGDDSIYFNRFGTHGKNTGAAQSRRSPYSKWFNFSHWPDSYDCWWGFKSLPNVNEMDPDFRKFILSGKDSVVRHWLRCGASGWRLDVTDELPMPFLRELRREVKGEDPDAIVLGEVWEDASHKTAYNELRSYVLGDTLDSVMNYPLREVLINYLLSRISAVQAVRILLTLQQNYPPAFFYSLMNLLGSHDRPRILNILGDNDGHDLPQAQQGLLRLSEEERMVGLLREHLMLRYILSIPGMPCVYYGDEAAMSGAQDPFCRGTFPWGREDLQLQEFYRRLISLRHSHPVLKTGTCRFFAPNDDILAVFRDTCQGLDAFGSPLPPEFAVTFLNRSMHPVDLYIPGQDVHGAGQLTSDTGKVFTPVGGAFQITLPALQGITLFG